MLSGEATMPAVSVLVCTRDRRAMLDLLLNDLRAQQYNGAFEIIVVEETDAPRPPEGVRYVPHPVRNKGIAFARNMAVEQAAHALVVFVDDDCRVAPTWLAALVAPFADATVLGVQGGVTVPQGTNAIGWAESLLGFPGGGIGRIRRAKGVRQDTAEVSTLNAAYRREALLQAGGFTDAARFGGEDFLLARSVARQGRLQFVPDARVLHAARGSIPAIWHWFVRRGRAEVGLLRSGQAPAVYGNFMLRSSLLLKLGLSLLTLPWFGWLLPLLLFVAMAGATAWRMRWVLDDTEVPNAAWWVVPLVRLTMDLATDAGRLRGLIADRDKV